MRQAQTIEAIYENGILRPLEPIRNLVEQCKVKITIEQEEVTPHPLLEFAGILSDEEAEELKRIIENEFEGIDSNILQSKVFVDREDAVEALHEMMNEVHERTKNLDHDELDKILNEAIAEVRQTKTKKTHIANNMVK